MEDNKKINITEDLLDDILNDKYKENEEEQEYTIDKTEDENNYENENFVGSDEDEEYDIDDLLSEEEIVNDNDDDFEVEDENTAIDINKYLQENYNFKEIDKMSLEDYISSELKKPIVQEIKKIYDSGLDIKNFPTFEELMEYKKRYNNIFIVEFGTPLEEEIFGIQQEFFICKTFRKKDYDDMVKEIGDFEEISLEAFNDYMISNCVLFPKLRTEDVSKIKYGIFDVLLPAILKYSRFEAENRIIRI